MSAYFAIDIDACWIRNHRFHVFGSDKTPMKRGLICLTCSDSGKTAVAAYGVDNMSFGQWRRAVKDRDILPEYSNED